MHHLLVLQCQALVYLPGDSQRLFFGHRVTLAEAISNRLTTVAIFNCC